MQKRAVRFICESVRHSIEQPTSLQLRLIEQPDYLKNHKSDKTFYKDYRKKLHASLGMDDSFSSECSEKSPKKIHQVS